MQEVGAPLWIIGSRVWVLSWSVPPICANVVVFLSKVLSLNLPFFTQKYKSAPVMEVVQELATASVTFFIRSWEDYSLKRSNEQGVNVKSAALGSLSCTESRDIIWGYNSRKVYTHAITLQYCSRSIQWMICTQNSWYSMDAGIR